MSTYYLTCSLRNSIRVVGNIQLSCSLKLSTSAVKYSSQSSNSFKKQQQTLRKQTYFSHNLLFSTKGISQLALLEIMAEKPNVVFVLGGPGAGKGTQCSKIVEHYGFVHLSAGDLLREERNKAGSEYGELIEKHIRDGTIVPVEITCSLIDRAMQKNGANNFLIDGFPRNQNNLDGWNKEMKDKVNVLFVLFFDAPEDICVQRCLQRGQAGSGRSDDNPDSMKKRVATYVNETMPIIEHFQAQDLVRKINAAQDPEAVFQDVQGHFDKI